MRAKPELTIISRAINVIVLVKSEVNYEKLNKKIITKNFLKRNH